MELWYDGSRQDDIQEGVNTMVKFAKFTKADHTTVIAIAKRAVDAGIYGKVLDVDMDISAVYFHCPLRLNDLLSADQFNFTHDLYGIKVHLNRQTGELEHHFLPRFAR
jgi:hypothetical protein